MSSFVSLNLEMEIYYLMLSGFCLEFITDSPILLCDFSRNRSCGNKMAAVLGNAVVLLSTGMPGLNHQLFFLFFFFKSLHQCLCASIIIYLITLAEVLRLILVFKL